MQFLSTLSFPSNLDAASDSGILSYYPFGMLQPGRQYSATTSSGYRFGFNGQEKDNGVIGTGNLNTAQYWEYDSRLGRRWNLDPVIDFGESNYSCFSNNPIINIDPFGNTDYFNNKGKFIGSDGIDNGLRLMSLSKKTSLSLKEEIHQKMEITMNGRDIIPAPSTTEVGAMRTAWTNTENGVSKDRKSGHEEGFVSGGGEITFSEPGKSATLPGIPELPELNEALREQNNDKSAPTTFSIHTHPDLIDAQLVLQGTPSDKDFENASAVEKLLKQDVTFGTIGVNKKVSVDNTIISSPVKVSFYNSKGNKGSISLKNLEKAAKKIETYKK